MLEWLAQWARQTGTANGPAVGRGSRRAWRALVLLGRVELWVLVALVGAVAAWLLYTA